MFYNKFSWKIWKNTIRIKDSKLRFYFNSSLNLFFQCLRDFEGDENSFRYPLYFSIGIINKNQFRSKVEITKIFFDKEIKNKELIFNNERFNNRKKQKNIIKIIMLFIVSLIFIFFYPEFWFSLSIIKLIFIISLIYEILKLLILLLFHF